MSRQTRIILVVLVLTVLVVIGIDAIRQRRDVDLLNATLPARSFTFEPPEARRGLDRTPLTYQAEFVAHLAEVLHPSLVLATPAEGLPTTGIVLQRGDAREGRPHAGPGILVAATSGSDGWTVQTLGGRVVRAVVRGRDLVHGVLLLEPAEPMDVLGVPLATEAAGRVGPFVAIEPTDHGAATRVIPAPGGASRLRARLVRDGAPAGAAVVDLDGALVGFMGSGPDAGEPLDLDLLRAILGDLRAGRPHQHPWIGADLQTIDAALRPLMPDGRIAVVYVDAGSPAAEAGLHAGDILDGVTIDEATLQTAEAVRGALTVGAAITALRVGPREGEIGLTVEDLQRPPAFADPTGVAAADDAGIAVRVMPGSDAATAGLRTGDVVEAINQKPATTLAVLSRALAGREPHLLTVRRDQTRRFIVVPPAGRLDETTGEPVQ